MNTAAMKQYEAACEMWAHADAEVTKASKGKGRAAAKRLMAAQFTRALAAYAMDSARELLSK